MSRDEDHEGVYTPGQYADRIAASDDAAKLVEEDVSLKPSLWVTKEEGPAIGGVIRVVLNSGQVFAYDIEAETEDELAHRAREHCHMICTKGYRSSGEGRYCQYPVHRIDKVTFTGGQVYTDYPDRMGGT